MPKLKQSMRTTLYLRSMEACTNGEMGTMTVGLKMTIVEGEGKCFLFFFFFEKWRQRNAKEVEATCRILWLTKSCIGYTTLASSRGLGTRIRARWTIDKSAANM